MPFHDTTDILLHVSLKCSTVIVPGEILNVWGVKPSYVTGSEMHQETLWCAVLFLNSGYQPSNKAMPACESKY